MPRRALLTAARVAGVVLGLALAAPGAAQDRGPGERGPGERGPGERGSPGAPGAGGRTSYANPSAVIAAELAFARDARTRGQWTAFAAAAAPDAVMFVPQMVWAQQWLLGRANPPAALTWQPHEVWSSCDGSLMVSRGVWQAPGATDAPPRTGWFTTLWQRQPDGAYRWVLDHGDDAGAPEEAPDMIAAHIADCPPRPARREAPGDPGAGGARPAKPAKPPKPPKPGELPPLDPTGRSGSARDASLRWEVAVAPDGSRRLSIFWTKDGREQDLLVQRVAAPAPSR